MASTVKLQIITPEAVVFSEDVEMVTLPAVEGQIGVMPLHEALMTQMVPGEAIVRKGGQDKFLAVGEGLIEITADGVSILTDMAIAADSIDEAKAEEARQRAAARLQEKLSSEEVASVNASMGSRRATADAASSDTAATTVTRPTVSTAPLLSMTELMMSPAMPHTKTAAQIVRRARKVMSAKRHQRASGLYLIRCG